MAQARGRVAALEGPRISWGLATLIFLEAALVAGIGFGLVAGAPTWLTPILAFFVVRLVADLAKAFGGGTAVGVAVDGHARAASWPILGLGLLSYPFDPLPLWTWGLGVLVAGLSLWGHHTDASRVSLLVAREEGILGAWASVAGIALASGGLPLPAPWNLLVPMMAAVLVAVFAVRTTIRLVRRDPRRALGTATSGWTAWYQEHFFRLTILLVALVAYLFVRDTLGGFVPFLTLFEWGAATAIFGLVLWTLRNHLRRRLVEDPVESPHKRHEPQVERHGEPQFDAVEYAFGRFLDEGETDAVAGMAERLQSERVPVRDAWGDVLRYTRRTHLLLVHPGWLYAARLLGILLFVWGMNLVLPGGFANPFVVFVSSAGVWFAQFNRYGGPWSVKSALAVGGFLLVLTVPFPAPGPPPVAGLPLYAVVAGVMLLPGLVHPLRARKGRPIPLYAYQGTDPLPAIERLRRLAERSVVVRGVWLGVLGLLLLVVLGEVTRVAPEAAILLNVYLLLAIVLLLSPVLRAVGLRIGKHQVETRHQRERAEREARVRHALDATRDALGAPA